MSKADDIFYRQFGIILIALILFTLVVFVVARAIGARSFEMAQNNSPAVLERIRPFGQVRVGKPDEVVAAVAAVAPASAPAAGGAASGEQVYSSTCMACHAAGVAGAPKTGDKTTWEQRFAQGLDALVASSLKGKGAMPPKGGNTSLSDAEVKSAVEYMLREAGLMEAIASTAPAPAAEPAPALEPAAAEGQTGEAVYSKACVACHSTGAAGAPKLGDKAAWEPRKSQGLDALVMAVLKGKGAMPAKGGNNSLSEGDIRKAVEFMLAGAGPAPSGSDSEASAETASADGLIDSSSTAKPGDQVYMTACVNCHARGVDGAPKVADRAAWASLEAKGVDALLRSVVAGKGAMPPKGGSASLSEDEIRGAIEFMLDTAKFSPMIAAATQSDTADAAKAQPATSAEAGVAVTKPAPAAGQAGEAVYKKACIACHSTGAAGAPRVGDDAAWKPRAEKGIDTLVGNAVSGVGTMPPKGGNTTLSDEEVRNAVLFMLEQSGGAG